MPQKIKISRTELAKESTFRSYNQPVHLHRADWQLFTEPDLLDLVICVVASPDTPSFFSVFLTLSIPLTATGLLDVLKESVPEDCTTMLSNLV